MGEFSLAHGLNWAGKQVSLHEHRSVNCPRPARAEYVPIKYASQLASHGSVLFTLRYWQSPFHFLGVQGCHAPQATRSGDRQTCNDAAVGEKSR